MKLRVFTFSLLLSLKLDQSFIPSSSQDFSSQLPPHKRPRIVVVDTGVNSALYPKIHSENCLGSSQSGHDEHGHGTHVISLILKNAPEAEVISLKYFSPQHSDSENLISFLKCLKRAKDFSPDFINISGGGPEFSDIEQSLIQALSEKQTLMIMAAGNFSQALEDKAFYPASYQSPYSLVVGSLDILGKKLQSSNYSKQKVHGGYLGQNVRALTAPQTFSEMTGTSQATALLTGLGAKLWMDQPELRHAQAMKSHLQKTALREDHLKEYFLHGQRFEFIRAERMKENSEAFKRVSSETLQFSDL
jgi:subtilisin family serine protease